MAHRALLLLALVLATGVASADEGAAPDLGTPQWIAVGPADPEVPGQLLVVELWATWCGPCHLTFPMLSELQRRHGDRVRVVALTDEDPGKVRRFFHENREQMRIGVGVVDTARMQDLLFGGFSGRGIPSVYVLRDGRVLWSGAPEQLEREVARLLAPEPPP